MINLYCYIFVRIHVYSIADIVLKLHAYNMNMSTYNMQLYLKYIEKVKISFKFRGTIILHKSCTPCNTNKNYIENILSKLRVAD